MRHNHNNNNQELDSLCSFDSEQACYSSDSSTEMCKPIDTEMTSHPASTMLDQIGSRAFASWLWTSSAPLEDMHTSSNHVPATIPPTTPRRRTFSYDPPTGIRPRRRLSLTEKELDSTDHCDLLLDACSTHDHNNNPNRRSSPFSLRNLLLLGMTGGLSFLIYVLGIASMGARPSDEREIETILQTFGVTDAQQERRLKEIKADLEAGQAQHHKILVVGMAESLQELQENDPVISALTSLCWVYGGEDADTQAVDVRILYKSSNTVVPPPDASANDDPHDMDDDERVLSLQELLTQWGCRVLLESEEIVWQNLQGEERIKAQHEFEQLSRYKRLAKLRSFHRSRILASPEAEDYAVVINVDMDVVQLPPILAMLSSMDRMVADAEQGVGNVVCANGFETWKLPWGIKRQMFYDTLAAIDVDGFWLYPKLTTSMNGVIQFAQNTFLRDILRKKRDLWPMQSCFGGVAMYDFDTWATPECDYDEATIRYVPDQEEEDHIASTSGGADSRRPSRQLRATTPVHALESHGERWSLDPKYTLSGSIHGDACEHTVFQKCLHDHNKAEHGQDRVLKIGIQPDLVIQREAAILGRMEDLVHVAHVLEMPILYFSLVALAMFPLVRYWRDFYCRRQRQRMAKKHVHEA